MKLIFLDIDGVLNHQLFYKGQTLTEKKKELRKQAKSKEIERWDYGLAQIDEESVSRLNDIIDATGAEVVLSSSWRINNVRGYMQQLLDAKGFCGKIIGYTPTLGQQRGFEIEAWLHEYGDHVDKYVILDDDSDMTDEQIRYHYIHCDGYCGLTPNGAYKAIRILNGEQKGQFRGIR
jgi:hypothetical protein